MDSTLSVFRLKRKGISTYIAVLLLIILAVAAGLLLWAYFMGYLGAGTPTVGPGKAMVIDNLAQQGGELLVYVKNVGVGTLRLSMNSGASVYVEESRVENYVLGGDASEGLLEETKTGLIRIVIHSDWRSKTVRIKVVASDGTYAEGSYKIATPSGIIIQATAGPGGHIIPSGFISVDFGSDKTFTWTVDPTYYVLSLTVNDIPVTPIPSDYTFYAVTQSQTIHVEFQTTTFTIAASAGAGGSITPSGSVPVTQGSSQSFTITPNTGYHILDVKVDSISVGPVASYTFTAVTTNHAISASFAINTFTIAASAGAGGSITPSGSVAVAQGSSQSFTITPGTDYKVQNVIVDGVYQGSIPSYTFTNVQAAHTISVTFVTSTTNTYIITASAGAGGSIAPSGSVSVTQGSSQSFTITPSTGYHIVDVLVDGVSQGALTSYTFTAVAANHAISASFAINTFTIAASAGAGGSISPSGSVVVNYGANQAFTITPDTGYKVLDVIVDGVHEGSISSYTFNSVQANHVISASFTSSGTTTYTITASASAGGSITPSGSVPVTQGSSQSFTITPSTGYHIVDVLVDGVSQGALTSYQFSNVQAAHTISASFAINTFTITASAGSGGSISPSGSVVVNYGANQAFTITPSTGNKVLDVVVDGVSQGSITSYPFTNVQANHVISASFTSSGTTTYTITASAGAGGSITPSGSVSVAQGSSQTFTITPSAGYKVLNVVVDGVSQGSITSYPFTNVQADHTISVTFVTSTTTTYIITASAGAGGSISPSGSVVVIRGESQTFTITPNAGYVVSGVVVDSTQLGALTTYTFTNVQGTHTIAASFVSSSGNRLVYISGASQTVFAGTQSGWITIQRQTSTGTPITSGTTTVNLVKSSSTGRFTNPTSGNTITSITISSGSTASFCYMDTVTGTSTLTATASGYVPAATTFTITPGIATSFTPSKGIIPSSQVVDTARLVYVTSDAGGTVTYTLYSGIYPSGTLVDSSTVTVTNGIVPNSKAFTISPADAYYFLASYSGDAKNIGIPANRPEEFVVWPSGRTLLLRPNADTSDSDLGTYGSSAHYACVDDATPNGDTDYVYAQYTNFWTDDTYALPNPAHTGTINYVTIHAVSRTTGIGALQLALTTHGQEFDGSNNPGTDFPLTTTYQEYTKMWNRNPVTGAAWIWQEIDDLQIGCSLYQVSGQTRCTQIYIEVYYTP